MGSEYDHTPTSRFEEIMRSIIDGTPYEKEPRSVMEALLIELKETIEEGSGGGGIRPIGVTTTPLYDGATANPIQINGESYTAETGDMVTYQSKEFLFNVNEVWQELGDVSVVLAIIDDIFANIAPVFNAASTYAVDDYVIYNNQLYKCTTAHTGAWAAADFTATSLSNEIKNNKGTEYTAGDYVNITNDNVINVRVSKGTVLNTYRFTTQNSGYAMKIEKFVKGVKMSEVQYSNTEAAAIIDIDGVMEFGYKYAGYLWYYKLLTDSREHVTDQVVEWYYTDVVDKSENFDVSSDVSKNIVLQEDLINALAGKQDTLTFDNTPVANSNNPVKSGGVYSALAGKQDSLTAGSHIAIDNGQISVQRWAVPAGKVVYTIITSDENYGQNVHIQRHTPSGGFIDDRTFLCEMYKTVDIDGLISINNPYNSFEITLLEDSDEQQAGFNYTVNPITTPTSNSFTFTLPQEENDNDLIIRSEFDTAPSVKELRYTGTGENPNVIDFGNDTPSMIMGIYPDPDETYAGGDYNSIMPFAWNNSMSMALWSQQNGGVPYGNGGTNLVRISYSGNVATITSANSRASCNVDTQKYVVKYLT